MMKAEAPEELQKHSAGKSQDLSPSPQFQCCSQSLAPTPLNPERDPSTLKFGGGVTSLLKEVSGNAVEEHSYTDAGKVLLNLFRQPTKWYDSQ